MSGGARLSAAAKAALAAALAGDGRLHCAPAAAGLRPRVRWNVAIALEAMGCLVLEEADPRANIYCWAITEAGRARALAIPAIRAALASATHDEKSAA